MVRLTRPMASLPSGTRWPWHLLLLFADHGAGSHREVLMAPRRTTAQAVAEGDEMRVHETPSGQSPKGLNRWE